jgi:Peptidase inhibitor I78 family
MKAALVPFIALAGCAMTAAPEAVKEIGLGECSAEAAQGLIGQTGTSELAQTALVLAKAKVLRWTRPGMAVTMDYRTDRLNIDLDERNAVRRISCG